MLEIRHHFLLEVLREGETLARRPLPAEVLDPAVECLQLEAVRRGVLPPRLGGDVLAAAAPDWDPEAGEPYLRAVRVALLAPRAGGSPEPAELLAELVPSSSFRALAEETSEELVKEGKLKQGEVFTYRLAAFAVERGGGPRRAPAALPASGGVELEEVAWEMPLAETPLARFLEASSPRGPEEAGEIPAFIPRGVLAEVEELKERAGAVETGGVILGRLHRDPVQRDLFVEVTAQIHARHAHARSHRLTFTAETWSAVEDAIRLRGDGEIQVGFYHTHPARAWCGECAPSRWPHCPLARPFYSSEDRNLHRALYPRAFTLGLVAGDEPAEGGSWKVFHAVFGWSRGALRERGFRVLEASPRDH